MADRPASSAVPVVVQSNWSGTPRSPLRRSSIENRPSAATAAARGVFERFLENLGFQCLLAEQTVKLANVVLQGSVIRRRHNFFATARRSQTALRHQAAPRFASPLSKQRMDEILHVRMDEIRHVIGVVGPDRDLPFVRAWRPDR